MVQQCAERADAARNRRAVPHATEQLLVEGGGEHVSLDRVAALAEDTSRRFTRSIRHMVEALLDR